MSMKDILSKLTEIQGNTEKKVTATGKKVLNENTGVTDYEGKHSGGNRKEALKKYANSKDSKDAAAARKAGATQAELKKAKEEVAESSKPSLKNIFNSMINENQNYTAVNIANNQSQILDQDKNIVATVATNKANQTIQDLKTGAMQVPQQTAQPGQPVQPNQQQMQEDEGSQKRLVKKEDSGSRAYKIYKDMDWDEYIVKFYENGKYNPEADYHTDDKEDAFGTAKAHLSSVNEGKKAKPDFLDLDKDGNKKESMKKAATDAKKKKTVKEGVSSPLKGKSPMVVGKLIYDAWDKNINGIQKRINKSPEPYRAVMYDIGDEILGLFDAGDLDDNHNDLFWKVIDVIERYNTSDNLQDGNKKESMKKAAADKQKVSTMKKTNEAKAKPDFLDLDKDGDKKEPMKKAAADAKKKVTNEGKMKELDMDLKDKTMSDVEFKKKYKKTKAEMRKELKSPTKQVNESMNKNAEAARFQGKADALAKVNFNSSKYDEGSEEITSYLEGYKEGLDDCYGSGSMGMDQMPAMVPGMDAMGMDQDFPQDDFEEDALIGGSTTFDAAGSEDFGHEPEMDMAFEAWDNQLNSLLNEDAEVNEGVTVAINKDIENAPDSVTVTAQGDEADQLLAMIKQAGMGLFGGDDEQAGSYGAPMAPDANTPPAGDVGDHDSMMALLQKMTTEPGQDYEDEESMDDVQVHGHPAAACGDEPEPEPEPEPEMVMDEAETTTDEDENSQIQRRLPKDGYDILHTVESNKGEKLGVLIFVLNNETYGYLDNKSGKVKYGYRSWTQAENALIKLNDSLTEEEEINEMDDSYGDWSDHFDNDREAGNEAEVESEDLRSTLDENIKSYVAAMVSEGIEHADLSPEVIKISKDLYKSLRQSASDSLRAKKTMLVIKITRGLTPQEKKLVDDTMNQFGIKYQIKDNVNDYVSGTYRNTLIVIPYTQSTTKKGVAELAEWANDANNERIEEDSYYEDIDFMTKVISGGLNNQKQDQTTLPHTKVTVDDLSDWKKLSGLK